MRASIFLLSLLASIGAAAAQSPAPSPSLSQPAPQQVWQMQDSGSAAGLRGIDSVDGTIAWASGTNGTVLRTIDAGAHWTKCAVPDASTDGATLDFRGIQAWDAQTAIVMASGPGDKSRLYKTTDGCKTWKLLGTNGDKEGFWDALRLWTPTDGFLAGDPVKEHPFLAEFTSWSGLMMDDNVLYFATAKKGEGAFAASNSSISLGPFDTKDGTSRDVWFATGGLSGSRVLHYRHFNGGEPERATFLEGDAPTFPKRESGGIFAIAFGRSRGIAVGGDYTKPNDSTGTAAWSADSGLHWTAPTTPPHGYRSTVQWSELLKLWITAGTNGSDVSRDDGKTWQPLDNGNWNALSLPFIVGPNGRIARLNPAAIPQQKP